ncbi:hypothetical protein FEM48_Zijuj02G0073400 [Ziziphus jujuba var. spinosa]|uniref:Scarecrow-like protein 14 n=1 Tax=Ziziphus jujuba var. spinosa TaxID=714518 RepID=A0A978VUE1_ZIZJJ|nr:hypothetical protein FEM48_Zijuj02G0073400 [Ziziphus jujuba var. spinosa]
MIMDPSFTEFSDFTNGFVIDKQTVVLPDSNQFPNLLDEYKFDQPSPDLDFMDNYLFFPPHPDSGNFIPSMTVSSEVGSSIPSVSPSPDGSSSGPNSSVSPRGDSSPDESEFSESVIKYISQILMEEKIEEKPCMFFDPLGLQITEKSFYDVLVGEKNPNSSNQNPVYVDQTVETHSPNQHPLHFDQTVVGPDDNFSSLSSDNGGSSNSSNGPHWLGDIGDYKPSISPTPLPNDHNFRYNSNHISDFSVPTYSLGDGLSSSSLNELAQNIFRDSDSISQFNRGLEEASKFLPKGNQLIIDLESSTFSPELKGESPKVVVKEEKSDRETSPNGLRGRKNHERENIDLEEERSAKQSAVYVDESDLSDMFDRVLLCTDGNNHCAGREVVISGTSKSLQPNEQPQGPHGNGGRARSKKQGKKRETVDLRTLLILCAQAVSANDIRTAHELLKQIRQHSSPSGDGCQRLAHFFANGLEARIAGTGVQTFYSSLASKRTSAVDILKCYQVHLSAFPFKKMSMFFANKMILKMAEKATKLHIVDFGILYGFQWPILIQHLSSRSGGPPKLRITGIEIPQPGFRPSERIEETGRRLAKYCERFGVPFEYNAIASQTWETIQVEELKIDKDEVLAVNSLFRFKNLLDETVEVNCPRNAVLNLIRKMNPNIFVNNVVNGSFNAPFFVTRFREALFHYSALFDMFDINVSRESEERSMFEREFYGREAMNVIACEGSERVERPETHKQWQVRTTRAGFRPLPPDRELMDRLRAKLKAWYHKDFVIDEDSHWMLQGWKGRIVYASSCWVPA